MEAPHPPPRVAGGVADCGGPDGTGGPRGMARTLIVMGTELAGRTSGPCRNVLMVSEQSVVSW